ncbi:MFS transporter [Glutamicibacter sp. AOP5-B1-3]
MSTSAPPLEPSVKSSAPMKPAQVMLSISGLMAAIFTVLVSSTVVATPMPEIVADLRGTNTEYTWVLVAAFLSMTVTTPIWGKLSDIFNRKLLLQIGLIIFVVGTVAAGFSSQIGGDSHEGAMKWLIGWRLIQSIGTGGLMALVQVVMADIISPRERGKYMGIMGAVMAVGQIGGPLLGGVIADSWGWEWCFYVCVPFAVVAFLLIQGTLHINQVKRETKFDFLGAALIISGISLLLIWISLGGKTADSGGFAWDSTESIIMVSAAAVLILATVFWELRIKEPIIPLRLFAQRTFALSSVASIAVGVTMFGTAVFLSQYLQLSRGFTPTHSGLQTLPMVLGSMFGAIVVGQLISRTGYWKKYVVGGGVVLTVGLYLMSRIDYDTPLWFVDLGMFLLGLGSGVLMQNLVLVTQNSLPPRMIGSGSGAIAFFRSLGGTIGVSVLGTVLGTQVSDKMKSGMDKILEEINKAAGAPQMLVDHPDCADSLKSLTSGTVPAVNDLCEPVRTVVESAYGQSIAFLFLLVVPLAIVTLICAIFLPNKPLSKKTASEQIEEELGGELAALEPAERGGRGYEELIATGAITLPPEEELAEARKQMQVARRMDERDLVEQVMRNRGERSAVQPEPELSIAQRLEAAETDAHHESARVGAMVEELQSALERARTAHSEIEDQVGHAVNALKSYDKRLNILGERVDDTERAQQELQKQARADRQATSRMQGRHAAQATSPEPAATIKSDSGAPASQPQAVGAADQTPGA